MEGWIRTYRELENHWIWQNDKYLKSWLWFLFRANHTVNKVLIGTEFIEVQRGEFLTSIYKICEATGMSAQSTRTFLKLLQRDKMINKQATSKLTKVTICNYDYYQSEQQTNNKRTNKLVTSSQQARNKLVTTDKNEKNNKNEKNEKKEYADFVFLLENEYHKLVSEYGEKNTLHFIDILNNYKGANGKKYNSDYRAILSWVIAKTKKEGTYKDYEMELLKEQIYGKRTL